ncbi:MAG: glycosyltransferase family 2 protein [Candidatus Kerfeldbacteria bacterium]|nr:glycosyltransferase family 2 protein [Candidatus Kerfeldbacteria bacterium]
MIQPAYSIVIATYHGAEFMPGLFHSIHAQTVQPAEVVVIDNSTTDAGACAAAIRQYYPEAKLFVQHENRDFCAGYNLGMQKAQSEYIFILNQDMVLEPRAAEELLSTLMTNERIGAVAPIVRRLTPDKEKTSIIDTVGIQGTRARRFTNRGEGEEDRGQYVSATEPFGISGAAMLFRKAALTDVAQHGGGKPEEYFDEDFVAYKDDVDMSYRLRHRGWRICIVPSAMIYHQRTAQETKINQTRGIFTNRNHKSFRIRSYSLRNHWSVLIKNEPLSNIGVHAPWIFWYELRKILFVLFFEWDTLKTIPSFIKYFPRMLAKRRAILSSSTISAKQLRSWFA